MKREIDLNIPDVQELSKEELKKVDGGLPLLFWVVASAWAVVCLLTD